MGICLTYLKATNCGFIPPRLKRLQVRKIDLWGLDFKLQNLKSLFGRRFGQTL